MDIEGILAIIRAFFDALKGILETLGIKVGTEGE